MLAVSRDADGRSQGPDPTARGTPTAHAGARTSRLQSGDTAGDADETGLGRGPPHAPQRSAATAHIKSETCLWPCGRAARGQSARLYSAQLSARGVFL